MLTNGAAMVANDPPSNTPITPAKKRVKWSRAVKRQCRNAYIEGLGSIPDIANLYGVPAETCVKWCAKERWQELRRQFEARETAKFTAPEQPEVARDKVEESTEAGRLSAILRAIEEQCKPDKDGNPPAADVLAKLSQAHDRFFRAWQVLTGTQNPGNRKPAPARRSPANVPTPQGIVAPLQQVAAIDASPSDSVNPISL